MVQCDSRSPAPSTDEEDRAGSSQRNHRDQGADEGWHAPLVVLDQLSRLLRGDEQAPNGNGEPPRGLVKEVGSLRLLIRREVSEHLAAVGVAVSTPRKNITGGINHHQR